MYQRVCNAATQLSLSGLLTRHIMGQPRTQEAYKGRGFQGFTRVDWDHRSIDWQTPIELL